MPFREPDTSPTTARFDEALADASARHRLPLRDGDPVPYIAHLLAVSATVLEMRGGEAAAIAALLHGLVEDGGGPAAVAEIRERFGDDVADLLLAVPDVSPDPEWRQHIDAVPGQSPDSLRVSLAHGLQNARALLRDARTEGDAAWSRLAADDEEPVRRYWRALTEAFETQKDALGEHARPALEELGRIADELDRLAGDGPPAVLPRLYVSLERDGGTLRALEFGRIDDGQPEGTWQQLADDLGLMLDAADRRPVGFAVTDLSAYDPDDAAHAPFWEGPRFDVPQLGLRGASINETAVATRALYGDGPSLNRELFGAAIGEGGDAARAAWLACLQAGDPMAHFALGYSLLELGRHHEAYRHLRHYTEISPALAWNWVYRARAAQALGHLDEARHCLRRGVALDRDAERADRSDAADELVALLDLDARGMAFGDLVQSTELEFSLMGLGGDELALVDGPGFAALLRLTLDDRLTVEVELGGEIAGDDLDDDDLASLLGPLRDGDTLRLDGATERLWLIRLIDDHRSAAICAALDELARVVSETVVLVDRLAEAQPPLTFAERFDDELPPW